MDCISSPVTILAVFDPTAGFATGGGTVIHNSVNANFGFNAKYHNDGSAEGSLDYVEHRSSGDVHVKGTDVLSLSVVGNTAVFVIHVSLNGATGYTAQVTVTSVRTSAMWRARRRIESAGISQRALAHSASLTTPSSAPST